MKAERIVGIRITAMGSDTITLTADNPIWTSGLGDMDPQVLALADVPKLVYSREPCWLFYRDTPAEGQEWMDSAADWDSSASGIFVPWVGLIEVLFMDDPEAGAE